MTSHLPANQKIYKERNRSNNNKEENMNREEKKILTLFIIKAAGLSISTIILIPAIHELSHWQDYQKLDMENETICIPLIHNCDCSVGGVACYRAVCPLDSLDECQKITSWTETKAYTITGLTIAVYLLFIIKMIVTLRNQIKLQEVKKYGR